MFKISVWASHHLWPSRFIIIGIYVVLNVIGLALGDMLFLTNNIVSPTLIYVVCFIFLTGMAVYPSKKDKSKYRNFYFVQKTADFILVTSTFLLIVFISNHFSASISITNSNAYAASNSSIQPHKKAAVENSSLVKRFLLKHFKNSSSDKGLKKMLKHNLAEIRKQYKEASNGQKIALIALSIVIALALLYLLAALSCSISCSGSDGLAILVALLGTGLLVFLLVKVIRRINREPKIKRPPPATIGA